MQNTICKFLWNTSTNLLFSAIIFHKRNMNYTKTKEKADEVGASLLMVF